MPLTTRNKIGLVLAALLALGDVVSIANPTPDGEEGPPLIVLVISLLIGVVTLVALVPAWRTGSRTALRAVAGTRIVSAILALPAFFVDVPAGIKVASAVAFAVSVVCVVLVLAPANRRVPVTD
ncbi:MAG TPA: hypothetical protein VLM05_11905 [Mycobacteriales bacterium]|nr:hypothetical protein [Mycobacteriales bacterium]